MKDKKITVIFLTVVVTDIGDGPYTNRLFLSLVTVYDLAKMIIIIWYILLDIDLTIIDFVPVAHI